jgi:phospholipid/cholesterol/gamma-HCH transport system substrate-binding protein/paraquat-inducible protein B
MRKFGYFKIGLFVISAILIGISGVIALGLGSIFQKKNLAETYIEESVQGLDVGSPVKFRGVSIGKVEQITLTSVEYPTRHRYVLVRFDISPNIFGFPVGDKSDKALEDELQYGFRVRLAAQGLTGVAYIEADYLDPDRNLALEIDWRPKYPYIPSAPSRITQLSESVERILRNVEELDIPQLTGSVEKSLAAMTKLAEGANLEQIGRQANALLSEIRDTNRQLGVLVHAPELKSALADTAAAAGTARKLMENAEKPVGQLLTDLPRVSESISHVALRLEAVTADLPQTSSQFQQTLQQEQIQSTLESLRSVTEDIQEFANESRKYPSQILFGAPPPRSEVFGR